MIEPDIDRYGTYARESALADFLELQAFCGPRSMSESDLANYVDDTGWTAKAHPMVAGPFEAYGVDDAWADLGDIDDPQDAALAQAIVVWEHLRDRGRILGALYPFDVDEAGLRLRPDVELGPYLFLLATAVSHAWKLEVPSDPRVMFERFVTRTVGANGLLAGCVGDARRSGAFEDRIMDLGRELKLLPHPTEAFRSRFANDERVDVVAHLWFGDERPGRLVLLGQATCADSDSWLKKFREPSPQKWRELLGVLVTPTPFLAIPHHAPSGYLSQLVQEADGILLDRLRLSLQGTQLLAEEAEIVDALREQSVQAA